MKTGNVKEPKRRIPTGDILTWRQGYLHALRHIGPVKPTTSTPKGLSVGNKKMGQSGSVYRNMFVWNLPSVATCPALSSWCMKHCYNADKRDSVFPVRLWAENWWWVIEHPDKLERRISEQLDTAEAPIGVRLHSSGDFFSASYIQFWEKIVHKHPSVAFWTYTRSWAMPKLRDEIARLRTLPNVSVFASYDSGMPQAPRGWPRSLVFDSRSALVSYLKRRGKGFICPEQIGAAQSCASCGYCSRDPDKDVLFYLH